MAVSIFNNLIRKDMKKILIATEKPFAKIAVEGIREIIEKGGYECVLLEKYTDKSQLLQAVADVHAIIFRSDIIDADVIEAAKNLEIAVRAGAGYDNIDLAASSKNKVVVMNTPGQNSNAVAELAIGMMIYMARNYYNGTSGTELKGKTIGIHAYGYVGKLVADIAKGFNMKVYAYDPFVPKEKIEADGVIVVNSAEALYEKCQYVSLHIPANEKTKKSINFELLNRMPKGATLVNTARKEVIDEEGLMTMFAQRPDFRYVSDIEPGCKSDIETQFAGKFYFTPKKCGAQTEEANVNAGLAAARQIVKFFQYGDKTFMVNE
jgi:D-3-phosphoglycerate dehydrogenase / 2-oxoglutarate reductase